ncbi:MAG: ubiquinone/menaquinone biosynthesis methyltransferase [Candidatus Omnitrophica bacterium]|nr:ubiquinone/menaquinone biosynthesis methyltransferase [Candidatus Omnitrophota bacterium]
MDTNKRNLSKLFSAIAARYDLLNRVLSFNLDRRWRKKLVKSFSALRNKQVLDLCCGTCDISLELAKILKHSKIYSVDFSHEMLIKAQSKIIRSKKEECIIPVEADIYNLPFREGTFDIASIAFGLRNLPDPLTALQDISFSLKEGGNLAILEFFPPTNSFFGRIFHYYLMNLIPIIANIFGGSYKAYSYLSSSIKSFVKPEDIVKYIALSKLKIVSTDKMLGGTVCAFYCEKS